MKRRPAVARTPAPATARRTPAGSPGPAGSAAAGQHERLLGLNQALGNQAMGALLAGQGPGLGAARESPSLLGPEIPAPHVFRSGTAVSLTVYFGKGFFLLDGRNLQAVESLAEELRLMAEPSITVDGYASSEGEAGYNQTLSERRRDLVVALLSKDREPRPTFGGTGHGEDAPAAAESGGGEALEQLRAQNRRVEIVAVPKPAPVSPEPPAAPPRLRLTPEELRKVLPPETPEERLNRMLREPPPKPLERKKRSLEDLTDEALDSVLDRMLKGVGVKDPKKRDFIRPKLRDAIKSGVEKGVDKLIDAGNLGPEESEALKKVIEAGAKQGF